MIHLRLLGSVGLQDDSGRSIDALLRRPKRLALLAYLGLTAREGFQRRDKLVALFWPESDLARARQALRQAVYVLRRELGENAILSQGDEALALNPDVVATDVGAFAAALGEGKEAAAADLYRGDLLEGFHISGAVDWERWLEGERARLKRECATALERLAVEAELAGARLVVARRRREQAALDPFDSRVVLLAARAVDTAGSPAVAVRIIRDHEARLGEALGLPLPVELADLLGALLHRGATNADGAPRGDPARPTPLDSVVVETRSAARRTWRSAAVLATVSCLATAGVVLVALRPQPARSGAQRPLAEEVRTLAVLPFVNVSADSAQEHFVDGVSDELTTALAQVPQLRVVSRSSAFTFKGRADVDVREKARRLGADAIVEGTVRRVGDRMRITAQLIGAADGLVLWSDRYDREVKDVIAAQSEIADAVARSLQLSLGFLAGPNPGRTSPEAYDLYLRGRYFANQGTREGLERSLVYYQRALSHDSSFAPIYAGIAFTYLVLADAYLAPTVAYPKAMQAAEQAIALNDGLAEAHALRSYARAVYAWDWPGATREAERAVSINASEPWAQGTRFLYRLTHGDRAGAVAALRELLRLDPLSVMVHDLVVTYMLVLGEADSALALARRAEEIAPGFVYIDSRLGHALMGTGRLDEALAVFLRAKRVLGRPTPGLALVYARMGNPTEAQRVLRTVEAMALRGGVPPELVAQVHAVLGNVDDAFAWLERGLDARSAAAAAYPEHHDFALLRTDPRWDRRRGRLNLD